MYIGDRDIGETIRILRTERGISREDLAERVGISRSHLNKIEADIKRPSIITYQKIMDVLEADISINDEATANVYPENEADLMNAVEELTKEKTIIMIAHRLKTVRKADQILLIEKGRIAEQGTHDVLLQKNGIYSSFICSRKRLELSIYKNRGQFYLTKNLRKQFRHKIEINIDVKNQKRLIIKELDEGNVQQNFYVKNTIKI